MLEGLKNNNNNNNNSKFILRLFIYNSNVLCAVRATMAENWGSGSETAFRADREGLYSQQTIHAVLAYILTFSLRAVPEIAALRRECRNRRCRTRGHAGSSCPGASHNDLHIGSVYNIRHTTIDE